MLDKQKVEKIIDDIFKDPVIFVPTELEWFNEEYMRKHPDSPEDWRYCRFFTCNLDNEELTQLLKHFNVHISNIEPEGMDKDSKLIHYYFENRDDEDHVILFQVEISEKERKMIK